MKYRILFFCLCSYFFSFSQFAKESKTVVRKETGFIYYVTEEMIAFVSTKTTKIDTSFNYFKTSNLNMAIHLQSFDVGMDTLWQYFHERELLNFDFPKPAFLKIMPVQLTYKIWEYKMSKKQFKESQYKDIFVIDRNFIRIKAVGELPVKVITIEPIL